MELECVNKERIKEKVLIIFGRIIVASIITATSYYIFIK